MTEPRQIAEHFYLAFARKDAEQMAQCYDDHVHFSDPVFPELHGERARSMWKMLCINGKDLRIEHRILKSSANEVTVQWDAWYTFSKTGRPVHNQIRAEMTIKNGKIVKHVDHFSFWRWSKQALGPVGYLLGWAPVIRLKVQEQAAQSLDKFVSKST